MTVKTDPAIDLLRKRAQKLAERPAVQEYLAVTEALKQLTGEDQSESDSK